MLPEVLKGIKFEKNENELLFSIYSWDNNWVFCYSIGRTTRIVCLFLSAERASQWKKPGSNFKAHDFIRGQGVSQRFRYLSVLRTPGYANPYRSVYPRVQKSLAFCVPQQLIHKTVYFITIVNDLTICIEWKIWNTWFQIF